MDDKFEAYIEEILQQPDVQGILVTDDSGLCLTARGEAVSSASGYVASIGKRTKELAEFNDVEVDSPVTVIQLATRKIFIKNENKLTVAVYRSI